MPQKKIVIKLNYSTAKSNGLDQLDTSAAVLTEWNYRRIAIALLLSLLISFILYLGWFKYFVDDLDKSKSVIDYSPGNPQSSATSTQEPTNSKQSPPILVSQQQIAEIPEKVSDNDPLIKKSTDAPNSTDQGSDLAGFAEKIQVSDEYTLSVAETDNRQRYTIVENQPYELVADSGISRVRFARKITNREPLGDVYSPIELPASGLDEIYLFSEFKSIRGATRVHEWRLDGRLISKREFPIGGDRWRVYSRKRLNRAMRGDWTVRITDGQDLVFAEYSFEVK